MKMSILNFESYLWQKSDKRVFPKKNAFLKNSLFAITSVRLKINYSASPDLWTPDLWTDFKGTKIPQIGYVEDFRKLNAKFLS